MMKSFIAVLALAAAGVVADSLSSSILYNVTTTVIYTDFTTYCSEATVFSHGGNTYTVTEATIVTVTDCPCTLTHPAPPPTSLAPSTILYTSCSKTPSAAIIPPSVTPAAVPDNNPIVPSHAFSPPASAVRPSGTGAPLTPGTPYAPIVGSGVRNTLGGLVVGVVVLAGAMIVV